MSATRYRIVRQRRQGLALLAVSIGACVAAGAMAGDAPPPARAGAYMDDYAALNAHRPGVISLPSGVQYEVLRPGEGRQPRAGDSVRVIYVGRLSDGTTFDSGGGEGRPVELIIDDIKLPGLKEALLLMREGARWRVVVPPNRGFRSIGNNLLRKRDLIYDIELVSVDTPAAPARPLN